MLRLFCLDNQSNEPVELAYMYIFFRPNAEHLPIILWVSQLHI